ncbi:CCR4-NOT transcription complex subunit 2-like [Watersipora subatra]|uniref:CCR4-NOT transcription complex subunit 2-like n=1 Tax=Watersipora subatra TaxID=2589382 RepID=UPI00355BD0AA
MSQRKKGFYVDDEDQETSMYFNGQTSQPSIFRERDTMYNTGSPSQAFTPTSNMLYQQQSMSRAYNGTGTGYQRSTPTSMLQPLSPNRNTALGSLAQRSFHHMNPPFSSSMAQQQAPPSAPQQQQSMQKRLANATNYSGFGQPQAFGFPPQQQARSAGTPNSSGDMQQPAGQMSIDLSAAEFPSLTNRNVPQNSLTPSIRNYVGMVGGNTKALDGNAEFSMQQEDFPALPGSTSSTQNGPENMMSSKLIPSSEASTLNTKDSLSSLRTETRSAKGVQTLQDGTVRNIPSGMLTDQYGMVGLLTFIRAADTDANLVALAPGVDLTSLGLNLNSVDNLYSTFQSPWADSPCRPQDIDYHVPTEYLTNAFIREKLSEVKFNRYGEDLLFYLFYCNPGDGLQLAASTELYNRDWRYHKEEQVWITRAAGMEPQFKSNTFEMGHYYVFDPTNWRRVVKELRLDYSKLEERRPQPGGQPSRDSLQQLQQQQLQHNQHSSSVNPTPTASH